jgi:hypothetical protein
MPAIATTRDWLISFYNAHQQLMQYVGGLSKEELLYSEPDKWNAGRQLQHVYLCLVAMSKGLSSKAYIIQNFGQIDRAVLSYPEVITWYKSGLAAGGKAPERFVPGPFAVDQKEQLLQDLEQLLQTLSNQLEGYSEEELDTLALPHPFLGKLSIREFFFLMTEHAALHQESIGRGLESYAAYSAQ